MDYKREDIEQYRDDPLELVRWMSAQGFIRVDDVQCPKCGRLLDLRGTSLAPD